MSCLWEYKREGREGEGGWEGVVLPVCLMTGRSLGGRRG